jgi:hypothetical protein
MKKCCICKEQKIFELFSKDKNTKDNYKNECKLCAKIYREKNKDYFYKYRQNNKERKTELNRIYQKERKKSDHLFKLRVSIRANIATSFTRGTNQFRKNAKTEKILGCTIEDFIKYIKSKFTEGMNLHNHGEWHLDHIYPVSLAKTKEEILKLNHYTNFQPLWAKDNIIKGNKVF